MAEMTFEQSKQILESAGIELERIDEARGAFSKRTFERVISSAMRDVDQDYLDGKYHKPAFERDGRSPYLEVIYKNNDPRPMIYVKVAPGWFEEGVMRRLAKVANQKLADAGIDLYGTEDWTYRTTKTAIGASVQYMIFNPTDGLTVDPKTMWIKNWKADSSVAKVDVGGKKMTFKFEKELNKQIRDNGSRQLTGHSSDQLWVSTDRSRAILVHVSCIHPAAGTDYSARLLGPEETQKYLRENLNESWRDDFEEDGLARYHIYLKLYDEEGTCIEDEEFGGDPYTYGHGPIDETEVDDWVNKIKRQWSKGVQLFSQKHDPKTEKLVIKGSPVIGSEDKFIAKSYDWTDKYKNRNKAWEVCWY